MILSRTPLRVSLVGGGTDLPAFYERNGYGCVISSSIRKYVYIGVNHRFDGRIRLAYSKNEVIDSVDEIENDRIRVALEKLEITGGLEIFYISDMPKQMGLGGSSSFMVGVLHALYSHLGQEVFPERLAREACQLEIGALGNPIGKQDQYAAAIGGMNYIKFWSNGTVSVKPILIDESLVLSLMDSLLYIYLGKSHDASAILADVNRRMEDNTETLLRMRDLTDQLYVELMNRRIGCFKRVLRENWELKKKTSKQITNGFVDDLYRRALSNGAEAGKILGAGGGGFLMVWVPREKQRSFIEKMADMKILRFGLDHHGTQVVHRD